MKGISYRDRDYAFGETMLALRAKIGLTQAGLANLLGVSRRAVADWEAGNSYPKAEHLKLLIALGIEQHAFSAGHEVEEVHLLWHASHQKVLLDEVWLSGLMPPMESPVTAHPPGRPHVDWGDALAVPTFYGRNWELNLLLEWVIKERCRVISLLGLGGIGKSALSVTLMHRVVENFEVVIWRSLRDLPNHDVLLDSLLQVVAPQALSEVHPSLEHRQSILLEYMRSHRVLVVLDNLECVLDEGEGAGHLLPGYEGIGRFLRLSAETEHQSCVLITSREKPIDLVAQEGNQSPVRALRLARLDEDACEKLLTEKEVKGNAAERARLIEAYTGNPLALKIVAQTIVELFNGEIAPFLEQGEVIFGGVRELLNEQFTRLSEPEQSVLLWLAILREPSTLDELLAVLVTPMPKARLLEAVEALRRRSLIELGQKQASFTLQSVVLEYATARLIAETSDEIRRGTPARLIEHGLALAQTREYVRQTQERLIIAPILVHLHSTYPQHASVEEQLLALLTELSTHSDYAQGYGPANLVALLRSHRGDLRGLDLSGLTLRGVYLQGIEMQDTTLSEATIQDSVFTETFDVMTAIAVSNTGEYWAAGGRRGEVKVWAADGLILHRMWRAHTDLVSALMFSPDGRTLATSGSWDGMVKLWEVDTGALLWSGRHTSRINCVAFAPDGSMLATSGNDAVVLVWDARNGTQLQGMPHPSPVVVVAWSPVGQLFATGDQEGSIRLWEVNGTEPATCVQTLTGHTNCVEGLAFAPDGRTIASASWDGTVKLWKVRSGHLSQTLAGHTNRVSRVVWSRDGHSLASAGHDPTMWLWDVEQGSSRAALQGHTAGGTGLTFTPDSRSLLSGSEDGTLRVWDVASGQCIRVIRGYAESLYDIDWSPESTQLVSGGSDSMVTIFDVTRATAPRVLRGHGGVVIGVGWSSDGRYVASSEWNNAVRLWEPASGDCLQVLQHPDDPGNFFDSLAWSPDGQRLASGTYTRGVQVFEMTAQKNHWKASKHPIWIRHVAWSPNGAQLAGGGADSIVYVWDSADGTLLQRLAGHGNTITSVAWSPTGMRLASGSSGSAGGELFVWEAQRGERLRAFAGHPGIVYAVAWGPSENLVISGSSDGMLRWWDVQNGELLWVREAHQGTVQSLKRSPDGSKLASCGDDGAIMLWDPRTGEHLKTLRRDRPYERLNITGIRGLSEAQKMTLRALGAIEDARNGD